MNWLSLPGQHGVLLVTLLLARLPLSAVDRFDVFLGYDTCIREMSWFPVVCEVENRGPEFTGFIEVTGGAFNNRTTRQVPLELPTGTTKRITLPVFFESGHSSGWDVRLRDEKGRVKAEQLNMPVRRTIKSEGILIGALSRNNAWTPQFQPIKIRQKDLEPGSARFLAPLFPENPLVLQGLDALYLNSERAMDLRPAQQSAITRWTRGGGHLIVAVEAISDVNSSPWLRELVPARLTGMRTVQAHPELQAWLRSQVNYGPTAASPVNEGLLSAADLGTATAQYPFADLKEDPMFESAELQVAQAEVTGGRVLASVGGAPIMIQRQLGLGRVTVLLFSPEREPFRSWKHLPALWSRLTEVPPEWFVSTDYQSYGGWSVDGIFGAMIDSRQVRKLPVPYLLALLVAYLVVIGPLDRWWLKKINRPMLTWITFPLYVVLFSGLIYLIGYKLRAGEREWNEFHVVDVLPTGAGAVADLRGHTYASLYSPVNQTYQLRAPQDLAALRGEAASSWSGNPGSESITVVQENDAFLAEAYVPVWTSQLYVNDWWDNGPAPLRLTLTAARGSAAWLSGSLENTTSQPLEALRLVCADRVFELGTLGPKEQRTLSLRWDQGRDLTDWVVSTGGNYQNVVQSRRRAFGSTTGGRLDDMAGGTLVASFISELGRQGSSARFQAPSGVDLSDSMAGNAVLLAYAPGHAPVAPMKDFSTVRSTVNTVWRLAVPLNTQP
jgi:hypothetical protein